MAASRPFSTPCPRISELPALWKTVPGRETTTFSSSAPSWPPGSMAATTTAARRRTTERATLFTRHLLLMELAPGRLIPPNGSAVKAPRAPLASGEAGDLPLVVEVALHRRRHRGQPGHGHDAAYQGVDIPRAGGGPHVGHRKDKTLRPPLERRIVRQRQGGLGHADRQLSQPLAPAELDPVPRLVGVGDPGSAVDRPGDLFDLLLDRQPGGVERVELARRLGGLDDRLRQLETPFAAVRPDGGGHGRERAGGARPPEHLVDLGLGVAVEPVHRD